MPNGTIVTGSGSGTPLFSGAGESANSALPSFDDFRSMINENTIANNTWSAEQAQKQMDFQKMMSDTAHQREVADLKAAGLNPILSASSNGASTPSGAQADPDQSGNSALTGFLGNLVSAFVSMENQRTSAEASLAVADKYNAVSKYLGELNAANAYSVAGLNAASSQAIAGINAASNQEVAKLNNASAQLIANMNNTAAQQRQDSNNSYSFYHDLMLPSTQFGAASALTYRLSENWDTLGEDLRTLYDGVSKGHYNGVSNLRYKRGGTSTR